MRAGGCSRGIVRIAGDSRADRDLLPARIFLLPLFERHAAAARVHVAPKLLLSLAADHLRLCGWGRRSSRRRRIGGGKHQHKAKDHGFSPIAARISPRAAGVKWTIEEDGSPGLIRTGGRPINSRMLYR